MASTGHGGDSAGGGGKFEAARARSNEVASARSDGVAIDFVRATRIRRAREAAGLTRVAVTSSLGWKPDRLAQLESGTREPTLEEALALMRLYAREGIEMVEQLRRDVRLPRRRR